MCLLYCKKEEEVTAPLPASEPRQLHREQIRTNSTAHGLQLPGAEHGLDISSLAGLLSLNTSEPTLRRVSDLPVGARLDHLITHSPKHEDVADLLRGLRIVWCVVCAGCC